METMFNEALSVPEDHLLSDHSHDGSMQDKLYHMKSRGIDAMNSMKRDLDQKWMPMANEKLSSMRSGMKMKSDRWQMQMKAKSSQLQMQLRSNPTKWAGIAAGAGFGLGLIGRIMRHRAKRAVIPHIVIIESTC